MREILAGVFHWETFHEGIGQTVHSYLVTSVVSPSVLIDPREPREGLAWFREHGPPANAYLTNRHHYRHSDRFARAFATRIWCHREGLHEFRGGEEVTPFEHGDRLPGGVLALEIGALCPEETALFIPCHGGVIALGDALIREEGELTFVPDELMGERPAEVKQGLLKAFEAILQRDFRHLLLAHGEPMVSGEGKESLAEFVRRWDD